MLEQGGVHPEKSSTYSKTPWKYRKGLLQVSQRMGGLGGFQAYWKDKELIGMDRSPKIQDCGFCILSKYVWSFPYSIIYCCFSPFPILHCTVTKEIELWFLRSPYKPKYSPNSIYFLASAVLLWQNGGFARYYAKHFPCIISPSPSYKVGNALIFI